MNSLKEKIKYYYFYFHLIIKDFKSDIKIPILKRINLLYRGFTSEKLYLYNLKNYKYHNYLSDHQGSMARYLNDPFSEIVSNKFIFSKLINSEFKIANLLGLVYNNSFYPNVKEKLKNILLSNKYLVCKPVVGGGGEGVIIIKNNGVNKFLINAKRELNLSDTCNLIKSKHNCILTEFVQQGKFANSLNPHTINTIRVLTLFDMNTRNPFIARAVFRIGTKKSFPVDNFSKGGLSSLINLDDGSLGPAFRITSNHNENTFKTHPESNSKIDGKIIPNWDGLKNDILNLCCKFPMLKSIGWDFILSDDGLVLIEANHHSDFHLLQCHGPMLLDKRVKDFYKFHGIIK